MTEQLEVAWKTSSQPFHNETVYTEEFAPIDALQPFLKTIAAYIELSYPSALLFTLDDWHEHDGFIVPSTPLAMSDLAQHFTSTNSLYNWRSGESAVYRSVYPQTLDFLLRVHILDEDEDPKHYPGIWGSMSFTGYGVDLDEIRKRGHGVESLKLKLGNSKDYFDRIYAG